jgi:serine/threonine-protein kinase
MSSTDQTTTHYPAKMSPLDEGVGLVLRAEERGEWEPVIAWLARHPEQAAELARFLATERLVEAAVAAQRDIRLPQVPGLEFKERLGEGTTGVVYRAQKLGRDVAVKLPRVACLSAGERARFQFEAEAVSNLNHPNVIQGRWYDEADGQPYFVMDYMAGGSLARWLHGLGPDRWPSPERAAEIVRAVALGTHHAHQRQLIHRDLKPGNVLLAEDGTPKIADFGLARPVGLSVTSVAGTWAYMAPEQARGEKRLTTAVDIHALGAILFELLAGRPPYGNDDVAAILHRLEHEPPSPLPNNVPPDLKEICQRCLAKVPADRPTAQAVADDLSRYLEGEPISGHRRDLAAEIQRLLDWIATHEGIGGWPALFLGAASSTLSLGAVQAAVLLDAPVWVGWACLSFYFVGWAVIVWAYLIRRLGSLNALERNTLVGHSGMMAAALASLPVSAWLSGGAIGPVFAPLFVIIGLSVFIAGSTFWGRLYIVGLIEMALGALLPLVPVSLWSGYYGLAQLAVQVWFGWEVWRIHREKTAGRPAR